MNFSSSSKHAEIKDVVDLGYKNNYNQEEATRILDAVNKFSPKDLKNYNISQMRLNKLLHHRDVQGDFKSIEDLLELEGFGVKVLERFCNSILLSGVKESEDKTEHEGDTVEMSYHKKNSFVTPALLESVRSTIKTVVSFQLDLNFFSWTKICYNPQANDTTCGKYYVEDWQCYEIGDSMKKLKLPDLVKLLDTLKENIPHADVYVIESLPLVQSILSSESKIVVNIHKAQLYAMVCAVMSSRKPLKESEERTDNVFFLKTFLPSRFYKYLVGNERVASATVIEAIMEYNEKVIPTKADPKIASIDIPLKLKEYWSSSIPVHKEYLGNSLLVGLTFMKLCVEKCNKSIASMKMIK